MPAVATFTKKSVLKLVCLLLFAVLVLLATLEINLRWRNPIALRLRGQTITLPKNVDYVFENSKIRGCDPQILQHRNSLGFRGAEPPLDSQGVLQIITVGGSTTECYYLSEGKTWTDLLGVQLAQIFPHVWINNAGLDGHSTFGHLQLLRTYILRLHPHLVLFLVGINDIERSDLNSADGAAIADSTHAPKRSWVQRLMDHSVALSFLGNLPRAAKAWRRGMQHSSIDLATAPREADWPVAREAELLASIQRQFVPPYVRRLKQLVEECRAQDIVPVLITQPMLFGPGRDGATGVDLSKIAVSGRRNGGLAWKVLELNNQATRLVSREEDVPLIDLAAEMPRSSRYFYDGIHFTNEGAVQVSQIVSRNLVPVARSVDLSRRR